MALPQLLPFDLFTFFIVFARLGAALMVMPGFGEVYVYPRYRLILAVALTLVVTPVVASNLPGMPASPFRLLMLLSGEIMVGLFLGLVGRIIMAALHVAGTSMSFQSGLANALTFDPVSAQQAALPALFLGSAGVLLVFVTDLHHLMLRALVASYRLLQPGAAPPVDDMTGAIARLVGDVFILGVQLAAPFIAVGLVFYLGIGLLARLMPQVQIFFIALPVQIMLAFAAFALASSAILMWFISRFEDMYAGALGG